jgi:hypothetical protein
MQVGFNYPNSYNRYGADFGPNPHQTPTAFAAEELLVTTKGIASAPLPALFNFVDRNLRNLHAMGVTVVRWHVLANGFNYGPAPTPVPPATLPPAPDPYGYARAQARNDLPHDFTPPPTLDPRFGRDFETLLERFAAAKLQLLPVLIDFYFGSDLHATRDPVRNVGACGRSQIITDPTKRNVFLTSVLDPLLEISKRHREQIYAWEVINEPIWLCISFGVLSRPNWISRVPEVTERQMNDFIDDATRRIDAAKFRSTVGHRWHADFASLHSGSLKQFHFYNERAFWQPASNADPPQIGGQALFPKDGRPILGEFDSGENRFGKAWQRDLGASDSTLTRLQLLEKEGCEVAMIWPDLAGGKEDHYDAKKLFGPENARVVAKDIIKLQQTTREQIAKFTGGAAPPAGE